MLDLFKYSENNWSVKTLENYAYLSDEVWDNFFNKINAITKVTYFNGLRLHFMSDSFKEDLCYLSNGQQVSIDNFMRVFFEVKQIQLLKPRKLLSSFYNYYEYPALIFSTSELFTSDLIDCFKNRVDLKEIVKMFKGLYIVYKGIEDDVLWFLKSEDMPDILP